MKTAVIGCGNISKMHLIALNNNPETEIIAVCDIKPERADTVAEKYGARAYYDIDELLKNENPDVLHICTPHYLHTAMAAKALAKGIHVLTEKPCSVTLEEVDALRKAQTLSGKQVGICFQNRYNGCVQQAKKIIDSGTIGKVKAIRAFVTWSRDEGYYSDDWHGTLEKECGGVLINQAIHTVDLIQYFGGKCKSLTAHVANDHLKGVIEVEDNASILMELEGGVTAMLYATTAYAENSDVLVEILTENGKLRFEGERLFSFDESGNMTEIKGSSAIVYHGESYWGDGHSALINDFYDCLKNGREFEIDAFEGGHAAKIVAASYKSAASGKSEEVQL
ncbi:MAG: Gfo/Idh/MocA family oxidoreductase [Clostridia bacterium]|nr:Gfo/Idh/MocA family oxidoreductase [Clostridia bacterium]